MLGLTLSVSSRLVLEGRFVDAATASESAFSASFSTTGPVFSRHRSVLGTVTIEGLADNRPATGRLVATGRFWDLFVDLDDDTDARVKIAAEINSRKTDRPGAFRATVTKNKAPAGGLVGSARPVSLLKGAFFHLGKTPRPASRKPEPEAEKPAPSFPFPGILRALVATLLHDAPNRAAEPEEVARLLEKEAGSNAAARYILGALFFLFNASAFLRHGKTFYHMDPEARIAFVRGLMNSRFFAVRLWGNIALLPAKYAYGASKSVHDQVGACFLKPPVPPEPEPRWMSRIMAATDMDGDETFECEAVVIGTGAGGAVVAKELAEKGFAVAMVEAGGFFRRESFTGNPTQMMRLLYWGEGYTTSVGNAVIPLPIGKAVGGTTLINSGTCFRTPDRVLRQWVDMGLPGLAPSAMAPYFDKVEKTISVSEADAKAIGPIGEVIKAGADALGYHSGPLYRNAIDCDGQGVCSMGCPTDAKQSTNITYVPKALDSAAMLFTRFSATDILTNGQRAIGVRARGTRENGEPVTLTIFAKAVILSAGSLLSPVLIQKNHLVRKNKWVGKNLAIHPASYVGALFPDRDMNNPCSIPQGYMIDALAEEGIMFEGGTPPFSVIVATAPGVGQQFVSLVNDYPHLGIFGYMIKDTSRGWVRPGPGGLPFVWYSVNKNDHERLVKAMGVLGRVFFAAGARRLILPTFDDPFVNNPHELEKALERPWKPRDFLLSAFHPVGTARMGASASDSATDEAHECHQVPGLFVVDGSSLPTSPGVNPQVTIMALATRAAERIATRLEG